MYHCISFACHQPWQTNVVTLHWLSLSWSLSLLSLYEWLLCQKWLHPTIQTVIFMLKTMPESLVCWCWCHSLWVLIYIKPKPLGGSTKKLLTTTTVSRYQPFIAAIEAYAEHSFEGGQARRLHTYRINHVFICDSSVGTATSLVICNLLCHYFDYSRTKLWKKDFSSTHLN